MRHAFVSMLLIASACSASPNGNGQSVPRNSPLETDIVNVPATTGRANLTPAAPPFKVATIGTFDEPFAMAFLRDGPYDSWLLVTEKSGKLKLRDADGLVEDVPGLPKVAASGQGDLLDVAIAPDFAASKT
ncbi:PQQ-dependent sugar dehydrogenase, partial [Sphingomonas bacterium]|uniref:PQQ-dependent sugar dehydrogenase n=1 Tax=Sphingomonas bacterium TaxID=1895847 RepID=UPI0026172447